MVFRPDHRKHLFFGAMGTLGVVGIALASYPVTAAIGVVTLLTAVVHSFCGAAAFRIADQAPARAEDHHGS
jgi:hypothetical protein